jgi:tRNA-binding protein
MKNLISLPDFEKIDIRAGTIISSKINNKLKKPSIILNIDFGKEIGVKKSSAQISKNYNSEKLINKQIVAIINFPPKQIGDLISEVLVLGFPDDKNEPSLISPDKKVFNGVRLY